MEIQYCVPDPSSSGWNGTHTADYTDGCMSRVCCEQDCCSEGTQYDSEEASCVPIPTDSATESPTATPTVAPTLSLTDTPTLSPTGAPTFAPTASPTSQASEGVPTLSPTGLPTFSPTAAPSNSVSGGAPSSPAGEGACETTSIEITYSGAFDTLFLQGFDESQVTWEVSGTSPFTTFQFTLPYADIEEIPELDNYVLTIPFLPKDTSSEDDTTLTVQARPTSPSCPNEASVHIALPRTCLRLCINGECRPVLCPLSYGTNLVSGTQDVSFAPSNTQLLFGSSLNCTLQEPDSWQDWILEQFGPSSANVDMAAMMYVDSDGDGLCNILEFYGHRIPSIYVSNKELIGQPSEEIEFSSQYSFSGFCPSKPDTDFDLLTDAFEWLYGFDPAVVDDITLDSDGDGLDNFEEQKYSTDPFNDDSDGDNALDSTEVETGSDPLSNKEKGAVGSGVKIVPIRLRVGDHSGSNSERYTMRVGDIVHQSPEFGEVSQATYNFTAGVYKVRVEHLDSVREEPDYDYVALINWPSNLEGFKVTIEDPEELLGRWLASSVDRTVGKEARLIIEELSPQGSCSSFASCASCNADFNCEWNERTGSCRPYDISTLLAKATPSDCACNKCRDWALRELEDRDWISELPQCPCNVEQDPDTLMLSVISDTDATWREDPTCSAAAPYGDCKGRPGASACIIAAGPNGTSQQCCYSKNRNNYEFIQHGECGSGTPDRKMQTPSSILHHYQSDILTYENCCERCEEAKCGATPSEIVTACEMYKGRTDGTPGARSDERGCI